MRFRYIDFSRSVLFSLGLLLHAAWLLRERSRTLAGVHDVIHSFRMECFFVIAGFLAATMLSAHSPEEFLRRRLRRLAIPMIFCGLTFNTLLACAHQPTWYDVSFLATPSYWLERNWLGHLWFLGTLIIYVCVVYGVHKIWPQIDSVVRRRKVGFPVFFCLLVVTQYVFSQADRFVPSTPWGTRWIISDKTDVFEYWTYFVAGYVLFLDKELLEELIDNKLFNGACVALYWLAVAFASDRRFGSHAVLLLAGANSLAMCGLLFWVGRRYFDAENRLVQSLSDMSYTVYLVHWPAMAILYRLVAPLGLSVATTFAGLVIVTGAVSVGFHRYVVRGSGWLAFLLNGQPRQCTLPLLGPRPHVSCESLVEQRTGTSSPQP